MLLFCIVNDCQCQDYIAATNDTYTTWGITSFICIILAMIVYQRSPEYNFPLGNFSDSSPNTWRMLVRAVVDNAMDSSLVRRRVTGKL